MPTFYEQVEQVTPEFMALVRPVERFRITEDDERIARTGEQDIQPLWRKHETHIITLCQRDDDDVALFIVCQIDRSAIYRARSCWVCADQ